MRILMLAQFYPPLLGGEERHVKTLSEALVRRGHEVSVATIRHSGQTEHSIENGVRVHRLQGTMARVSALFSTDSRRHAPPFPDPELTLGLSRIMRNDEPDVVHAHNWMLHSYLPLKALHRAKLVVTLHDYSIVCAKKNLLQDRGPGEVSPFLACSGPAIGKCLRCTRPHYGMLKGAVTTIAARATGFIETRAVDHFITVSRAVAEHCGLARSNPHVSVIFNFVPDGADRLADGETPAQVADLPENFILYVGDLTYQKGVHTLLDAYAGLESAPPLIMIGQRCTDTPSTLPDNVHWFESWPHAAVMHAWRRCLFGVTPSVWEEPCATVVMEAAALGKVIVATRAGGLVDLVDHEETGLLVAPGNVDELRSALVRLIANPKLRERLSSGALRKSEAFRVGTLLPRIETIYQELAEMGGPTALDQTPRLDP